MHRFALLLLFLTPSLAAAETTYIDDKVMVGVHQDKNVDSPIIKILPSGTALEIIKRDNPLSQVKEPGGASGWIDNRYLVNAAPGRAQLQIAENRIKQLETDLASLKSTTPAPVTVPGPSTGNDVAAITKENEELKQLLKSERLRVGELQAQTAELRNKLDKNGDNSGLLEQVDALTKEKTELQDQISALQSKADTAQTPVSLDIGEFDWKKMLTSIGISLIAGFIAGLYVLDLIIRRRHGGFRV